MAPISKFYMVKSQVGQIMGNSRELKVDRKRLFKEGMQHADKYVLKDHKFYLYSETVCIFTQSLIVHLNVTN